MRTAGRLGAGLTVLALLGGCFGGTPSPSATVSAAPPSLAASGSLPEASPSGDSGATSEPSAGELTKGTYAQVMVDGLRVRVSAKADATPVGALFFGDVVRIRAAAGTSGGYTWYEVESFHTANDQPVTGFVAGAKGGTAYLKALAGKPSPTPSRSPTREPSPTPAPSGSAAG